MGKLIVKVAKAEGLTASGKNTPTGGHALRPTRKNKAFAPNSEGTRTVTLIRDNS